MVAVERTERAADVARLERRFDREYERRELESIRANTLLRVEIRTSNENFMKSQQSIIMQQEQKEIHLFKDSC
jgi:hypothetical protein